MFGFVKKVVNAVSDTSLSTLDSIADTATNVSSSISNKASATYTTVSNSAEKITESVSNAAKDAIPIADKIITDGLLEMSSEFLKDDEKIKEVSMILWERIPREIRFFLSEEKFHTRTRTLRENALSKIEESKQKRTLIEHKESTESTETVENTLDEILPKGSTT
ncbi:MULTISPECIES: hypothetical protein [Bacteria]|nr:hypothetical protein [Klebsiella pneumoniae]EKW2607028.1 hypothetical protein [Klebsiella quasipneumoniae]HDS9479986.1 hypothetical protein [Klebsiella pneumoniae subsp. pneumoniae]HBR1706929.1 hypothetical protein [Klebsiella pneumoniae]HBS6126526.1 hypothetical protein [Klebsiella pneumoniae]HDS9500299.1 hypothetical protein [Klebsiella pneumoniae subsp. pneumoniae]